MAYYYGLNIDWPVLYIVYTMFMRDINYWNITTDLHTSLTLKYKQVNKTLTAGKAVMWSTPKFDHFILVEITKGYLKNSERPGTTYGFLESNHEVNGF